ncbi:MAG: PspC domain-containing protein [Candidatus Limnocylindrales bacterium]|jgi:phage shock protein C
MNPRRLYRSTDDRWIAGVAAGVADYFDVDPILIRIIWLVSIPLTGFVSLVAYVIMMVVVPLGPGEWSQPSPWQPGGAPVGYGAYTPPAASATEPGATTTGAGPETGAAAPADSAAAGAPQGAPVPGPTPGWDWRWQARQDRWQQRAARWEQRRERHGSGGIVFGALLIVVGGLIAWHEIDPRLDLNLAWPIAIIAFGVFLVISSVGYRRAK